MKYHLLIGGEYLVFGLTLGASRSAADRVPGIDLSTAI